MLPSSSSSVPSPALFRPILSTSPPSLIMSFSSSRSAASSGKKSRSGARSDSNPSNAAANSRKGIRKTSIKKSPFTDFGSYMVEKNRKLREQFEADASSSSLGGNGGSGDDNAIFRGVSIFVDGFTVPSNQELRGYMLKHGGRFENYFSRQRVTHIICSNLPDSKMKNFRAFSRGLPVVKPAWILDSVTANRLLSWIPYQLSELVNESGKQQKLSAFFALKGISNSNSAEHAEVVAEGLEEYNDSLLPREGKSSACRRQDCKGSICLEHENVCEERVAEPDIAFLEDEHSVVDASDSDPHRTSYMASDSGTGNNSHQENSDPKCLGASNQHHSTLGDPNFVENYFKSSRLHFIGTWRKRYRKRFSNMLSGVEHKNINVETDPGNQKASVIHIDMDCFFVSVIVRNYPELLMKPVAVCHSDNPKGTAEISSANYPAREYGVRAGMFVRDAKAHCPQLVIVPYDFVAYEQVADQFYSILHKHCNKVQALSCDEAFLDVSECPNNDPEQLASIIREEIAETTGCTASAGIAGNLLLARLATRSAKPNGQCFIPSEQVDSYLKDLPIKALPGIGYSLEEKLKSREIHTCGQLRMISKESLHKDFGVKTGDMLWDYCRGIDNRKVGVVQEAKSVGAEVNWGVRFSEMIDCERFLANLCKEVSFRLQECEMEGRTITLKVKKRRKGAGEPAKFMGCGDCESMSRSMTLPLATDDATLLQRITKRIFASFHISVQDVRGVGLQISRLEIVDLSRRGREKNSIESWLASSSKTREHKKQTADPVNEGVRGEVLCLGGKLQPDCGNQQHDITPWPQLIDETYSAGPSHDNPCSSRSHENRTPVLPPLCHLDMEVVKNLPPQILSEMNDMYNGRLRDFIKKYEEKDSKANVNMPAKSPLEVNKTFLPSSHKQMGCHTEASMSGGQTEFVESSSDARKKCKQALCYPAISTCNIPNQIEDLEQTSCSGSGDLQINSAPCEDHSNLMPHISNQGNVSILQQLTEEVKANEFEQVPAHGTRSCFDNGSSGSFSKFPNSEGIQNPEEFKIHFWTGNPPKWVEKFRVSNCLIMNVIAKFYNKSGASGQLSSILQSLFSINPLNFDLNHEGWDEGLSNLSELLMQYVDLKIESDIEELYLCFLLFKRLASMSKFLLLVYNTVLPYLQASVSEYYGGELKFSLAEHQ